MFKIKAVEAPLEQNLGDFGLYLNQRGIANRIYEHSGKQVLWLNDEAQLEVVRQAYQDLSQGKLQLTRVSNPDAPNRLNLASKLSHAPRYGITLTLIVLSFAGFVLPTTEFGFALYRHLTFMDFKVLGDRLVYIPIAQSMAAGEYWRLLTPIFLHGGPAHFTFNALWTWEFGRRIELLQGHFRLLMIVILIAAGSNIFQFVYEGNPRFGGMSGVIYGLLGYCWMWDRWANRPTFVLPPGIVGFMLVWMVLCMSGAVEFTMALLSGETNAGIANAAHLSGLVLGMVLGTGGAWIARSAKTT